MSNFWRLLERGLTVVGGFSLIAIIFVCNLNILGRYFRKPIEGSFEILSLGATLVLAASLLPTELSGGHIIVSKITSSLFKNRIISKIFDIAIIMINLCTVLWLFWAIVYHCVSISIPTYEMSMALRIVLYPFRIVWAFGLLLLGLGILKKAMETITRKAKK